MQGRRLVVALVAAGLGLVAAMTWLALRPPDRAPSERHDRDVPAAATVPPGSDSSASVPTASERERIGRGSGTISGLVREYGTERSIAAVEVNLAGSARGQRDTARTITREDGAFTLRGVPSGRWTVVVDGQGDLAGATVADVVVAGEEPVDVGVVHLSPEFAVTGVVVDLNGAAVGGASVRVLRPPSSSVNLARLFADIPVPAAAADSAVTTGEGRFRLRRVRPGTYDVIVERQGFALRRARGVVITPESVHDELRFVLAPGLAIDGRVVRKGSDGPVDGLPIVAFRQPESAATFDLAEKLFATTSDGGAFRIEGVSRGEWIIAVVPGGEAFVTTDDIDVPTRGPVEIVLTADASLSGRVTGPDGAPVAGAQVVVGSFGRGPAVGAVATDADGRYSVGGLRSGPADVFRVQAGYGDFAPYPDDLAGVFDEPTMRLTLIPGANVRDVRLGVGGTVRGRVLDRATGAAIGGARVVVVAPSSIFGFGAGAATSDASGGFEMRGVARGTARLTAAKEGWYDPAVAAEWLSDAIQRRREAFSAAADVSFTIVAPGEIVEVDVPLVRTGTISGRVLDPAREPVAGARVALVTSERVGVEQAILLGPPAVRLTGAQGEFELPAARPGVELRVQAWASGWVTNWTSGLEVAAGASLPDVEVRLLRGGAITGVVVDDADTPIEGVLVTCEPSDSDERRLRESPAGCTDATGTYRLEGVAAGEVSVRFEHPEFLQEVVDEVAVEEGGTVELPTLLERGAEIRGAVLGPDGTPRAGALVQVTWPGDARMTPSSGVSAVEVVTDSAGSFRASGLLAGTWRVLATAAGTAGSVAVDVRTGGEPVVVRLQPGFPLGGVVRFGDGTAVAGAMVQVRPESAPAPPGAEAFQRGEFVRRVETDGDGAFAVQALPVGTYDVQVTRGGYDGPDILPALVCGIEAGARGVIVTVERGHSISGKVFLPDGRPAAEGHVSCSRVRRDDEPQDQADGGGASIEGGAFHVRGLRQGTYELHVTASGALKRTLVAETDTPDLRVELERGGTLHGRVVDVESRGIARAIVTANMAGGEGFVAMTDVDGRFDLTPLPDGAYEVVAQMRGGKSRPRSVTLTAAGTVDVQDLVIRKSE